MTDGGVARTVKQSADNVFGFVGVLRSVGTIFLVLFASIHALHHRKLLRISTKVNLDPLWAAAASASLTAASPGIHSNLIVCSNSLTCPKTR